MISNDLLISNTDYTIHTIYITNIIEIKNIKNNIKLHNYPLKKVPLF